LVVVRFERCKGIALFLRSGERSGVAIAGGAWSGYRLNGMIRGWKWGRMKDVATCELKIEEASMVGVK
jgi:hypothetical protein